VKEMFWPKEKAVLGNLSGGGKNDLEKEGGFPYRPGVKKRLASFKKHRKDIS